MLGKLKNWFSPTRTALNAGGCPEPDPCQLKPAEPARWDGRLAVGAAVLLWLTVVICGVFTGHTDRVWRLLGVYHGDESFGDARVIAKAWDNVRNGHGAYEELPNESPHVHEYFNYPRVWLLPRYLGLGERDTEVIGCAEILFFYACAFLLMGRLTSAEALVYALAICSPAAMLAVEKGNCDLIVFGLVSLGVMWAAGRCWLSMAVLWLAAVLKLFPVFALAVCLRENKRRAVAALVITGLGFFVYVLATMPDIVNIRTVTPRPTLFGYGCMTLVDGVSKWLTMHGHKNDFNAVLRGGAFGVALVVCVAAGWSGLKRRRPGLPPSGKLDAFRAGALIYIGVFLIGNNYDYRLIFLLLCVGQLLVWVRDGREFRRPAAIAVLALLLSAWERWPMANELPGGILALPVGQVANWTLFALLAWFVAATLPDWLVETDAGFLLRGRIRG